MKVSAKDGKISNYLYIVLSLLYAKVCFHIVSAQYSAVSIAVEFVKWMSVHAATLADSGLVLSGWISHRFLPFSLFCCCRCHAASYDSAGLV